ncbi:hypothetical protein PSEUDO8O_70020 [Pseudomonas sp. 8O]|nr:hypothetical protein PSEUDO8O_70020 [Pseudomonas sp. 8O]
MHASSSRGFEHILGLYQAFRVGYACGLQWI